MTADAMIIIQTDAFGLDVDVVISPAPTEGNTSRAFKTYPDAFQYASNLAAQHGWKLVDRVQNENPEEREKPMRHPYRTCRRAALELLQDYPHNLTIKAAQFLGQICKKGCVEITEKQEDWLEKLLEKNKLPKLSANIRDREAEPKPAADPKASLED